jgi:hypothetical protein
MPRPLPSIGLGTDTAGDRCELLQLGMHGGHMIGIEEVLEDELPVARDIELQGVGITQGGKVVVAHAPRERFPVGFEIDRLARKINEHQIVPDRMAHRHQARRIRPRVRIVALAAEEMRA